MEAESADNIFVPQVSISRIPKIGQEFESHEEAYNFYNQYAREAGFSAPNLAYGEIDSGGPSSIGCVERDIRNHERNIREEQRGHDADTLIEYFTFEKERSPNFYFDYEIDSDNKLVHCFWADLEARRSYAYFGDAVVFDTTYNTNKYSMIFVPFVGVNHHAQTILFACGLLSDKSTESFVWLFSKFLEAMHRQPPHIIITDQDAAIAKAISMVLPFTFHRYCIWHILNKFSEKINVMVYNDEYHMLVNIIKNSESPDEFESRWAAVMENEAFANNEWLCNMFSIRSRWVPAYVNHIFSAGMSSSQRSESNHSFFKRWTKNAKLGYPDDLTAGLSTDDSSSTSLMARHGLLSHKTSLIVDEVALTDERSTFLIGEFESLHLRVKEIATTGNIGSSRYKSITRPDSVTIQDPSAVRAKGCGKRLKSGKEKSISKQNRQCRICGQQGYDKRTCPQRNEMTNTDVDQRDDAQYDGTQFDRGDDGTFT
ncbi:Protein FAR1-RELATED SEQUENCE 5 [Abeliophyllum distichum]|uniref:Protein FAR1-RELATED SEQUENCE 5 n=1 Tax=Abeliophyllum distichum TaxID=126358 RepID=A0ABD1UNU7_9LAMI